MCILIVESIANKPHLEISGEIALKNKKRNLNIDYAWVGNDLKWTEWQEPRIFSFLGIKIQNRVKNFLTLLSKKKINILNEQIINEETLHKIDRWSKKFNGNLNQLYKYKYKGFDLGKGVASSLISHFRDNNFNPNNNLKKVSKLLYSAAIVFERCEAILKKKKYSKIITFNGRFATCYPIILLAEKYKIKILRHERGSTHDKYEIFDGDIHNFNFIRKEITRYWKKKSKNYIKISQNYFNNRIKGKPIAFERGYSYRKNQIKNYTKYDKKKNEKLIIFYTTQDYENSAINNDQDQEKYFRKFLKVALKLKKTNIIIRVHPQRHNKNNYETLKWLKYESKRVKVIGAEDKTDSYKLMELGDIIVSYSSNIVVEAAYWGKKSISLSKNTRFSNCKSVITIKNFSKLFVILTNKKFKPRNKNNCLPLAYYFQTYGLKFMYYKAKNHFEGKFLGDDLNWKPKFLIYIEKIFPAIKRRLVNF